MKKKTSPSGLPLLASMKMIFIPLIFMIGSVQSLFAQDTDGPVARDKIKIDIQPVHTWRPPFHLDRIGHSMEAVITIEQTEIPQKPELGIFLQGKEISRKTLVFEGTSPFIARAGIPENADKLSLYITGAAGKTSEIASTPVSLPSFESDAIAQPDKVINPIDLGAILVPADWLLLEGKQKANLKLALLSRSKNISSVNVVAWYSSSPGNKIKKPVSLETGKKLLTEMALHASSGSLEQDTLNVTIVNLSGEKIWQKQIKVMLVPKKQSWPSFGAVKTKLRFDPPITNIVNGKNIPVSYSQAWTPEKEDYVIFLPNGSRWVFWRGSSYIPVWASRYNTGLSYEWAERISPNTGFTDCPEPLMDKELRYGHVEIIESTPARIHVRWNYQSCDFNYKVNGDYAQEDYYFYPDGLGTRVLTLTSIPEAEYEVAEFILLASQAALPFDVMPEKPMDIISLRSGRKAEISLPEKDSSWKKIEDPAIYRMRLHRKEPLAAFSFNPLLKKKPFAFGPFHDKGQIVTPAYWGGHWPLSQGFNTGRAISESIWSGPSHNSLLTWAAKRPEPLHSEVIQTADALGVVKTMRRETYSWLIGMTDATDKALLNSARSYADPALLELKGAAEDNEGYIAERRAYALKATDENITITIKPVEWCINPVFELKDAPGKLMAVKLDNKKLSLNDYKWDGKTLWIKAQINKPAVLGLVFSR